jgi:Zn-finger nucleic acid-binding protein
MLLNADAAASSFCSEKLQEMHEGFVEEGTSDDIDCPFCESQMKVRSFSFQRLDGSLTEPIEIDGCPSCSSFWLDADELHRLSPPSNGRKDAKVEANTLAVVLEILLQLPVVFV